MMAIKARLLFWRSARWSSDTFPAPINKWWNSFLCQFWSDLQKTSQMASPFDRRKKKKNPCDVIYSFCGRLVPYWIMKAATEEFCLRRSIGCFHCHNTRRRSETGIWQMACHLRQCDAARARVDALLHDFSNLGVIKCEKQSEMCAVCAHTLVFLYTWERKRRRVRQHEHMHTERHVRGCLIRFHTPTQKAFGACCATAHFAVTPLLI